MPESEFAKMAFNGLSFKIKDHFEDRHFQNLFDLGVRVAQYEQFRKGSNDDRPKWGRSREWKGKEKNISYVEESTSAQEEPSESNDEDSSADEAEVLAAEMLRTNQPYKCNLLKPNGKREAKAKFSAYTYTFDIGKTDQIFDRLLKDGRIKLQEGQVIPSGEELKRKRYCKWHHSWSHRTSDCTVFKRQLQTEINEGRLIFADQEKQKMEIDKNPFPPQINMVDFKGKQKMEEALMREKSERDTENEIAVVRRKMRLCVRCKTELTRSDWEEIIQQRMLFEEWKEFMAFPQEYEDIPKEQTEAERTSVDERSLCSEIEAEPENKADEVMKRVLRDYYEKGPAEFRPRREPKPHFGSKQPYPGFRPNWRYPPRPRPEPEFEGMTEGDIEFLGRKLINELEIQPWPRPWQRREILREHLRTVKVPANVPINRWHVAGGSAKPMGPMLSKTQKRRQQRMQQEAKQFGGMPPRPRPNIWNRLESRNQPFRPMRNDNEAGGSRFPQRKERTKERTDLSWFTEKIKSVNKEPTPEPSRKELEDRLAFLEVRVKRERGPPKERDVHMESDRSSDSARESEEKEARVETMSAEDDSADINMVYALPLSFKADTIEESAEESQFEEEPTGVLLRFEEDKADVVVFEKPSAIQTRFVRPLFIRALIEGRPVGRVMVDGGAMVNIMPTSFFKKLGKSEDDLKSTDTTMTDFTGSGQQPRGVLTTELTVGSKTLRTAFFVVDAESHYNLLLGRDWIHASECVPSTLHGKLFQWIGNRIEEIRAEGRPQIVDINSGDIGHADWADTDPDRISFVRVTEEGVQLVLTEEGTALVAAEEPSWLKWSTRSAARGQ